MQRLKKLLLCNTNNPKMSSSSISEEQHLLKRLGNIEGFDEKSNDIIFHAAVQTTDEPISGQVFYFGGDVQDYPENMSAHRDNRRYLNWNLEKIAILLSRKFVGHDIFVVRPMRMHLKTFSCFENFVSGDDIGSPKYELSTDGLVHLKTLLENVQVDKSSQNLTLVGFSKGCVVLNQFLYSFMALKSVSNPDLVDFVSTIKSMYWLDGGHSGGSNTWVTDKNVLKNFAEMKIKTCVHVTPYQMEREARPWVGKEEKIFRENLKRFGANIQRNLHFAEQPASLASHFEVLNVFLPDL